jgi:hypothetical protein
VQQFKDSLDEGNDDFGIALDLLQQLGTEREGLLKKLEFAKFSLEDCDRRALKAIDLYEDAELDMWKSETDAQVVCQELQEVERHSTAVAEQIRLMKQGGGVACRPKPCLHPDMPEEGGFAFELEPCSFCNRWYTSYDVFMASCKHFYHPFCITKLVDTDNTCVTCKETFHPAWWASFGFRPL